MGANHAKPAKYCDMKTQCEINKITLKLLSFFIVALQGYMCNLIELNVLRPRHFTP